MSAMLCIFGHPDDESFGCSGTIAHSVLRGVSVSLLTFTRGQQGARPAPLKTPEMLGLLREHELRAAASVLGIESVKILDYMDGQLDQADPEELAAHASRELERSQADTIITFGPTGITGHGDHIAAHHAAMEAARRCDRDVRVLYMAIEQELAEQFEVTGVEAEPTHRIDISDYFETKLSAMACHSSQEDAREFFVMLLERRLTTEFFHQAVPQLATGEAHTALYG